MPTEGIVTFIESLYRDPDERQYHSGIQGFGITILDGHRGVSFYGHQGAFLKGMNEVPATEIDQTKSS